MSADSLDAADGALLDAARAARERAYAPHSGYRVGAAVRTRRALEFVGCNVESVTNGLTLCAERVAIFAAITDTSDSIESIAVVVSDGDDARPCGMCLELIRELAPGARLVLSDGSGGASVTSIGELLPEIGETSS